MFVYTSTYNDYNGEERTESFYFDLSMAELAEMNFEASGGMDEKLKSIVQAKNIQEIARVFKEVLKKAYGVKSDDGRRFIKSEELSTGFTQTPVYSELYMKLATDDEYAAKFVNGILPKDKK